jgi:integrase
VCIGGTRFRPANKPSFCEAPRNVIDFVTHDLRRTVATFLTSDLGVLRVVVSKLLNHVEAGVTRVYDRASYDREKRQAPHVGCPARTVAIRTQWEM